MKQLLQKFGLLKTNSQKEIEKKLDDIAFKKKKEQQNLIKKREQEDKFLEDEEKKCFELWKDTFLKDFEFAGELKTIGNHLMKNTKTDIFCEYSKKDEKRGYVLFIIGIMRVHLSVKDKNTFNIRTYSQKDLWGEEINFDIKEINKCKKFFKEQIYKIYENGNF